jgi:ABC-type Mn2+/Zn2+ transport system permease subunit
MIVSATIGAVSAVTGLYLSYYLNIVSGSAIVLTATAIFLLVFVFHPRRGLLWKRQ